jgi:hypothetical protein
MVSGNDRRRGGFLEKTGATSAEALYQSVYLLLEEEIVTL